MSHIRRLHPGAWWLWALALGAAASRTTNPWLLGLILAVAAYVVVSCRGDEPWAASYHVFFLLGLTAIAIRLTFHVFLGGVEGETVLFHLPSLTLPEWAQGIRLGGAVTGEGLLFVFYDALRLATLLGCVGAANALADPKRMIKSLPAALYEVSVAIVVALSVAPQLVTSVGRVRKARSLRGEDVRGLRRVGAILQPVLHEALERSLRLAESMDSRGYGRTAQMSRTIRSLMGIVNLAGIIGLIIAVTGLLGAFLPLGVSLGFLGGGVVCAAVGLKLAALRQIRSRYRPEGWSTREWLVGLSGCVALICMLVAPSLGATELIPSVSPLGPPGVPLIPAVGIVIALLPAFLAPRSHSDFIR